MSSLMLLCAKTTRKERCPHPEIFLPEDYALPLPPLPFVVRFWSGIFLTGVVIEVAAVFSSPV
ncbi:hypothetical protein DPMN_120794 [Dreissena polymorpha]|uniref:Uncharacterized protein n=1 Tax=Dreissena polymorpha TaxID=45954 RepID=A0A9D4JQH0_DREPO|nr:hypothetical protein DPMN_120794 [Dreissena polymorpha]